MEVLYEVLYKVRQHLLIVCVALYLLLIFYVRDFARIGFYILALFGLFLAYQESFQGSKLARNYSVVLLVSIAVVLAVLLGNQCCIDNEDYYKPYLHFLIIIPFVYLGLVLKGWLKVLLCISVLIVISAIFSYSFSDYSQESIKYFEDHYDIYLLLVPIAYTFYRENVSLTSILMVLIIGCALTGLSAILDVVNLTQTEYWIFDTYKSPYPRFGANIHSIQFAIIVMSILSVTAAHILIKRRQLKTSVIFLGLVGVSLAIFSVFMSGTRGVWIAIPVVLFVLLLVGLETHRSKIISVILAVFALLALVNVPNINNRIELASYQFEEYFASSDTSDHIRQSSVGVRLEIWKVSWKVFKENPLFGVGPGVLSTYMTDNQYHKTGEFNSNVVTHRNPHNMYMKALADRGALGFVLLLLILLIPMCLFIFCMNKYHDTSIKAISVSGVIVVLIYSIAGLTIGALDNRQSSMCYIFFIGLLCGLLLKEKSKQDLVDT